MMDLLKALHDLEEVELQMAELYGWFTELYQDDEEAVSLFNHLRLEELSHQSILKYEGRIVRANPRSFRDMNFNLDMLDRTLESIRNFRQANPRPSLEEALKMALVFEGGAAELYYFTIFKDTAWDFAQFVTKLHAASRGHFEILQKFAARRKIALPPGVLSPDASQPSIPSSAPPGPSAFTAGAADHRKRA